ncbi:hypothetical protein [Azospirillum sp.]|uniref:hypothetical protein n=1 Tax=Azospirillum sp. TaxID=34012 RepID=UPI003D703A4B
MKTYLTCKTVEGAPIASCDVVKNTVTTEDGEVHAVPHDFFGRGVPPAGAYLLRYLPHGYMSWCPKDVFVESSVPAGKTLEDYFRKANEAGVIDFRLRAAAADGCPVSFYIHPLGQDGETQDFDVRGNVLAPRA